MMTRSNQVNFPFLGLSLLAFVLIGAGLLISWHYGQGWWQTLWHICQANLQYLGRHPQLTLWQLVIPAVLGLMVIQGARSLCHQIKATRQLTQAFYPARQACPPRVQRLLAAAHLTTPDIVFLHLKRPHAFCLGWWRPRIWLTAGLLDLLSDDELAAVLAHEARHLRQRDPLQLMIGRTLKSAFFFLPAIADLATAAELQQEVAADQAAIAAVNGDLPLLRALHKLIKKNAVDVLPQVAAYSPFNVTEARLRRLLYPPTPPSWRLYVQKAGLNLVVLTAFVTIVMFAAHPLNLPDEIIACTPEIGEPALMQSAWLDYSVR